MFFAHFASFAVKISLFKLTTSSARSISHSGGCTTLAFYDQCVIIQLMVVLLKRWIVYLLVPAGLVLLFVPLSTRRAEWNDQDFVFLEITETLATQTPEKSKPPVTGYASMESLTTMLQTMQETMSAADSKVPTITNSYGYVLLLEQDLASYPALLKELNDRSRKPGLVREIRIYEKRLDNVPIAEWIAFKKTLPDDADEAVFQYGNTLFKAHIESNSVPVMAEVEHLKMACKVTGGLFLFLSIFAFHGMYAPPSDGIHIGRRSGIILWDIVILLVGTLFTWIFLEFMLVKYAHTDSEWVDEMVSGISVLWVLFANPMMALITTATALQTLIITRKEIVRKGLFGCRVVAWSDVESIHLSSLSSPRKVGGILATRKVMKTLIIDAGTTTLRLMEPPFASTKIEILNTLTQVAPDALKETIQGLAKEWLSTW